MKVLLYVWSNSYEKVLEKNLRELGFEVVVLEEKCKHYTRDLELAQKMITLVNEENIELVVSYNYLPIISMVCNTCGIQYYCWVFDSPNYTLYAKTVGYSCNHIACFDKEQIERIKKLGVDTVYYVPLGFDQEVFKAVDASYSCDISFLGKMYTGEYNYYDEIALPDDIRKRIDLAVERQCFEYEKDYLQEFFQMENEDKNILLQQLQQALSDAQLTLGDDYYEDIGYIFRSSVIDKKITVEERRILLNRIASLPYDFRLYTGSDVSDYPVLNRRNKGYADYYKQMPSVFANSRINLNITLRSIRTGIPLRVVDIMGCGGFVLSNYQKELADLLVEDKEIVLFRSLEECLDKIDYYLSHEEERRTIALAGQRAIIERFSYKKRLLEVLGTS